MTTGHLEKELCGLLVETLMLEDISPADIDPEAPLFDEGLGLDSIDALELGMAISKKYKVKLSADAEENKLHFSSIKHLAAFIEHSLQRKVLENEPK